MLSFITIRVVNEKIFERTEPTPSFEDKGKQYGQSFVEREAFYFVKMYLTIFFIYKLSCQDDKVIYIFHFRQVNISFDDKLRHVF